MPHLPIRIALVSGICAGLATFAFAAPAGGALSAHVLTGKTDAQTPNSRATFAPAVVRTNAGGGAAANTTGSPASHTHALANATTGASSIGLWAADWGGAAGSRSAAAWQAAAQNDSILIGQAGVYKKWIPQLHAWNPSLKILSYDLGPYLQKGSADYTTILAQNPTWFAHDAAGRLINLPAFPGNYLMEMSNAGYRAWHAQQVAAKVTQYGFDGAMDDSMGSGPLGSYSSSPPVNPATGLVYTEPQYLANSVLMLNGDKAALNGKYLAFNGLVSGPMYARGASLLATSNADAGVSELFLRQPNSSASSFPSSSALQQSLQMMSDMAAHGKAFLGWTKVWSTASAAQVAAWEQFALAAYLLGQQTGSYLDFMPSHSADNTAISFANLKTQMGAPMGSYKVSGSMYTRVFQNGTVSINAATNGALI